MKENCNLIFSILFNFCCCWFSFFSLLWFHFLVGSPQFYLCAVDVGLGKGEDSGKVV